MTINEFCSNYPQSEIAEVDINDLKRIVSNRVVSTLQRFKRLTLFNFFSNPLTIIANKAKSFQNLGFPLDFLSLRRIFFSPLKTQNYILFIRSRFYLTKVLSKFNKTRKILFILYVCLFEKFN